MVDAEGLLEGPWNAWLINPVLGTALEVMGSSYHVGLASITLRCREIATLIIGRTLNCEFELYAHIRVARANGVTEDEISDIVEGRDHKFEDEVEQVIFDTVPLLLAEPGSRRRAVRARRVPPRASGNVRPRVDDVLVLDDGAPAERLPRAAARGTHGRQLNQTASTDRGSG